MSKVIVVFFFFLAVLFSLIRIILEVTNLKTITTCIFSPISSLFFSSREIKGIWPHVYRVCEIVSKLIKVLERKKWREKICFSLFVGWICKHKISSKFFPGLSDLYNNNEENIWTGQRCLWVRILLYYFLVSNGLVHSLRIMM